MIAPRSRRSTTQGGSMRGVTVAEPTSVAARSASVGDRAVALLRLADLEGPAFDHCDSLTKIKGNEQEGPASWFARHSEGGRRWPEHAPERHKAKGRQAERSRA